MGDIETVSEAYIKFLEEKGIGTFGETIYLSQVPDIALDDVYWAISSGGSPVLKLKSGEVVKQYFISTYYRSTSAKNVERNLFKLEEILNCADCVQLEGFEVYETEAQQFSSDADIDNEERRVGFLQANIKIYKKEC